MNRDFFSRRFVFSLGLLLAVIALVSAEQAVRAGQDAQQGQANQGQSQEQPQGKQKKKGGFLSGVKAMRESSKEQTSATSSAGTKGVDNEDGQKIADTTPTTADQQAVAAMDSYNLPRGALPKFIEGGHLKPKQ